MIPTHKHPDTVDFYESEFFVEDSRVMFMEKPNTDDAFKGSEK